VSTADGGALYRAATLCGMGPSLHTPVRTLLTSRRAVDLCRVGSCLCSCIGRAA